MKFPSLFIQLAVYEMLILNSQSIQNLCLKSKQIKVTYNIKDRHKKFGDLVQLDQTGLQLPETYKVQLI